MTEQDGVKRIVAVGEILWDLLPAGPRLGGAMANFATGCARLGRAAALVSRLGADPWGNQARAVLEATQRGGATLLDTSLLQADPEVPTGLVEVIVKADGQPSYAIAMPAAWDFIEATPAALRGARAADALCFGTLCQRSEVSRATIRALIASAPSSCLRVLDVNVRAPFFSDEVARWSMAHATLAKISEEEMHILAGAAGVEGLRHLSTEADLHEIEQCGRRLLAAYGNLHLLAVTMGARGSLLLTTQDAHYHPGHRIEVVDTVGAGDAFTAGLVHAWLAGATLAQCNAVGNLCGSFVAGQAGATPVFPASLLHQVETALRDA